MSTRQHIQLETWRTRVYMYMSTKEFCSWFVSSPSWPSLECPGESPGFPLVTSVLLSTTWAGDPRNPVQGICLSAAFSPACPLDVSTWTSLCTCMTPESKCLITICTLGTPLASPYSWPSPSSVSSLTGTKSELIAIPQFLENPHQHLLRMSLLRKRVMGLGTRVQWPPKITFYFFHFIEGTWEYIFY